MYGGGELWAIPKMGYFRIGSFQKMFVYMYLIITPYDLCLMLFLQNHV